MIWVCGGPYQTLSNQDAAPSSGDGGTGSTLVVRDFHAGVGVLSGPAGHRRKPRGRADTTAQGRHGAGSEYSRGKRFQRGSLIARPIDCHAFS